MGAISSRYTAVKTPKGKEIIKQILNVKIEPISAPFIPAISADLEALQNKI